MNMQIASSERSASADRTWTVLDLLRWTTQHFAERGIETPRLDAECLLAFALDCDRLRLYVDYEKPVEEAERARFRELVRERGGDRVPVALLTGRREFWSLPLRVSRDVLVPRPETETLVATALELVPDRDAEIAVLDVGTGSGAIALALASERAKARITATDVSAAALAVARENADALGLSDRVRFLEGSLFEPFLMTGGLRGGERFDLVVSNPPYVAERDAAGLPPELRHEPASALFAGPDGTDVLRAIAAGVGDVLAPGGAVLVELDPRQAGAMSAWLREAGLVAIGVHRDVAGRQRVVSARKDG
jgi:release factor glutamine methyltransferase